MVSNIVIPELPEWDSEEVELKFSLEYGRQQSRNHFGSADWLSPRGENLPFYSNDNSYHWLRFPALADFRISADTKEVLCYPVPGIPVETIRHLLLDQVLPCCLAYDGKIMLHASAVQLEQGLLVFIGDSGVGKSTLAGNFHQAGSPAISDDCLWVKENEDQIVAVPSYGGLRLWEDSLDVLFASKAETHSMAHYSSKKRVPLNGNHQISSGMPVLAVIVLSKPGVASEVTLERLSRREIFFAMLRQAFQLDPTDLERMTRHVQALGRIVPRRPSFRLSMPHEYDLLPLVRQKILEAVL
jgi:hypothetical protein